MESKNYEQSIIREISRIKTIEQLKKEGMFLYCFYTTKEVKQAIIDKYYQLKVK